jgi:hypothetical protein
MGRHPDDTPTCLAPGWSSLSGTRSPRPRDGPLSRPVQDQVLALINLLGVTLQHLIRSGLYRRLKLTLSWKEADELQLVDQG